MESRVKITRHVAFCSVCFLSEAFRAFTSEFQPADKPCTSMHFALIIVAYRVWVVDIRDGQHNGYRGRRPFWSRQVGLSEYSYSFSFSCETTVTIREAQWTCILHLLFEGLVALTKLQYFDGFASETGAVIILIEAVFSFLLETKALTSLARSQR